MKTVNLNKVRKARAKDEKRARADANAVKFGRQKAERDTEKARAGKASRDLEGHKREK